jgi:hypothetical protein
MTITRSAAALAAAACLAVLTGCASHGTQLVMGPDRGDQSYPWRVSFRHYMTG